MIVADPKAQAILQDLQHLNTRHNLDGLDAADLNEITGEIQDAIHRLQKFQNNVYNALEARS